MIKEIYNEIDFLQTLKKAKEEQYKITFCSEKNADDNSFTSNYKYIQIKNKMNKVIEINTKEEYVIVESGVTWFNLIQELDKYGYTIISCQSGLTFSVGGSFCGNVHGKKTKIPMVKDTVIEIEYIDGIGNKNKVQAHDTIFHAFPGSLGLLGFITKMKIQIQKKYGVRLQVYIIPFKYETIHSIYKLSNNENVCMINFQCSYFEKIQEILLSVFYIETCNNVLEDIKLSSNNEHIKIYYTFIIILFWLMSKFEFLDEYRWSIEKNALYKLYNPKCININNSYDTWTKLYVKNFKIMEFFFPIDHFLYCQKRIMKIFSKYNMKILSSGSRIVFEKINNHQGFLRFSQYASKEKPYVSLVLNFIEDISKMENITDEIREQIINKNIKMTYHTTYSWNFSKKDMYFMFPEIFHFILLKKNLDPYYIFSNKFSEKYF